MKVKTPDEFFNSLTSDTVEQKAEVSVDDLIKEEFGDEASGTEIELQEEEVKEDVKTTTETDGSEEEETEETSEVNENKDELFEFEDENKDEVTFDFASIAKEIGLPDEVKDKDSFVSTYRKSLEKAKEDALADLPESLKEAVEFAKQGGDYKSLLEVSSIDYDKTSSVEIVKASVHKYFKNEDGSLDTEALNDWFDSKSKAEINIMGDQIREKLKFEQSQKLSSIREGLNKEKEKSNQALKEYINKIEAIGGVKLNSYEKDSLYNDTVAGVAIREMFYGEDGKISQKKLAENLFKVRKFEKAVHLAKSNAKTEGKREVLNRATNSTVKKAPGVTKSDTKPVSPLDAFYSMLTNKT